MQIYTLEKDFGEEFDNLLDTLVYPCMIIKLYCNKVSYYTNKNEETELGHISKIDELEKKINIIDDSVKQMFYAFGAVVPEAIGTDNVGIYQNKPVIS